MEKTDSVKSEGAKMNEDNAIDIKPEATAESK
jgi:hypothetical protein